MLLIKLVLIRYVNGCISSRLLFILIEFILHHPLVLLTYLKTLKISRI